MRKVITASISHINGVTTRNYAAPEEAVSTLRDLIARVFVRPDVQACATHENIVVVLVPETRKLTALPEFASLKDKRTGDGRAWDDTRGVGGVANNGEVAVGVPAENLIGGATDRYGARYSVAIHEMAHAIFSHCLSPSTRARVHALFAQRDSFVTAYAALNVNEYFAEATAAFFDKAGQGSRDRLQRTDPAMFALMTEIYEQPARARK